MHLRGDSPLISLQYASNDWGGMTEAIFAPDGIYGDTPYRVLETGQIEAMVDGRLVRFGTVEQLISSESKGTALAALAPDAGTSVSAPLDHIPTNTISNSTNATKALPSVNTGGRSRSRSSSSSPVVHVKKGASAGKRILCVIAILAVGIIAAQFVTIFVIQPIGAVPEG